MTELQVDQKRLLLLIGMPS